MALNAPLMEATVMVDISLYIYPKLIECTTLRVNPSIRWELWVAMVFKVVCRWHWTHLWWELLIMIKNVHLWGLEAFLNSLHFLLNFAVNPKLLRKWSLLKKFFFKTRKALGYNFYLSSSVILDLPITWLSSEGLPWWPFRRKHSFSHALWTWVWRQDIMLYFCF